jgi:uncharacterized protein (AIM24 family)
MELEIVPGFVPGILATLGPNESVYAEHGIVLYKEDPVKVNRRVIPSSGFGSAFKRTAVGGVPYFLAEFTGPGAVSFTRNGPGEVRTMELGPNDAIDVAEGSLVCAQSTIAYETIHLKGTGSYRGIWFDQLKGPGRFALHAYGNFVTLKLGPGEKIVVERGAILHKTPMMKMLPFVQKVGGGLLGRFMAQEMYEVEGPGTVGLQTGR